MSGIMMRMWTSRKILLILFCALPVMLPAQQEVHPPPDNPWQSYWNWAWDIIQGRTRRTSCVDTCDANNRAISICTTEIFESGGVLIQYYTQQYPYPQDPNFNCPYTQGQPGGAASSFGSRPRSGAVAVGALGS